MAFDPSTAVLEEAAPAAPGGVAPAPFKFDPTSATPEEEPLKFDPTSAVLANPADRLQQLAPVIASGKGSTADDEAYKQTYVDYYTQNGVAARLGATAKALGNLGTWEDAAHGLWNYAKATGSYLKDVGENLLNAPDLPGVPQMAQGAGAVAAKIGTSTLGLLSAAQDQAFDALGSWTGSREYYDRAANDALARIKMQGNVDRATANHFPQTSSEWGGYEAGNILGNVAATVAPLPGLKAAGIGEAASAGGDLIGAFGQKLLGSAVQAGGKAGPTVTNAALLYGGGKLVAAHPVMAGGSLLADLLFNGDIPAEMSAGAIKSSAVRSGLFQGVDTLGRTMRTTPIGQGMIDSLVARGPDLVDQAGQMAMKARKAVTAAQQALETAKEVGMPINRLSRGLRVAQKAQAAAVANQYMMEQGTRFAEWLQKKGASGLSRTLANGVTGALAGGALGGAVADLQAQPGDESAALKGAVFGTGYGLILSQLGSAIARTPPGVAEVAPSTLRQEAERLAVNRFEPAAAPHAAEPMDSIILDGIPRPAEVIGETLREQGHAVLQQVKQEPVIGETYDLPWMSTREMGKFGAMSHPGDSQIQALLDSHKPIDSSAIYAGAYDPKREMASVFFSKGKKSGAYHHYVFGQVPTEDWADLLAGVGADGSIGKAFNGWFRNEYPYGEVMKPPQPPEGGPSGKAP